jgi:hypothetical protein
MLRDKSLIPLSHQHQRALALCVRIDRAQPIPITNLQSWQTEIEQHFEQEINIHFSAEEQVLFPAASQFPELIPLVEELIADHTALRESFNQAKARSMSAESLPAFSQRRTPTLRASAAVDECNGSRSSWDSPGRSSQRHRAVLHPDERGNEAKAEEIVRTYVSSRKRVSASL